MVGTQSVADARRAAAGEQPAHALSQALGGLDQAAQALPAACGLRSRLLAAGVAARCLCGCCRCLSGACKHRPNMRGLRLGPPPRSHVGAWLHLGQWAGRSTPSPLAQPHSTVVDRAPGQGLRVQAAHEKPAAPRSGVGAGRHLCLRAGYSAGSRPRAPSQRALPAWASAAAHRPAQEGGVSQQQHVHTPAHLGRGRRVLHARAGVCCDVDGHSWALLALGKLAVRLRQRAAAAGQRLAVSLQRHTNLFAAAAAAGSSARPSAPGRLPDWGAHASRRARRWAPPQLWPFAPCPRPAGPPAHARRCRQAPRCGCRGSPVSRFQRTQKRRIPQAVAASCRKPHRPHLRISCASWA